MEIVYLYKTICFNFKLSSPLSWLPPPRIPSVTAPLHPTVGHTRCYQHTAPGRAIHQQTCWLWLCSRSPRSSLLEDKFYYSHGLTVSSTSSIHQVRGLHIIYSYANKSLSNNILRSLKKLQIVYCYAIKALPNSLPISEIFGDQ